MSPQAEIECARLYLIEQVRVEQLRLLELTASLLDAGPRRDALLVRIDQRRSTAGIPMPIDLPVRAFISSPANS